MFVLYNCPTCGKPTTTLCTVSEATDGKGMFTEVPARVYCPACAPVPTNKPNEFRPITDPIMLGGVALERSYATGGVVDMKGRVVLVGETGPEQYGRVSGCDPRLVLKACVPHCDPGDCGTCG